jgi:hypothetical protein
MNASKLSLPILLIVLAMVSAFVLGTVSVTGSVPAAPKALSPGQWAPLQVANSLLLDQGPVGTYLPVVIR